METQLNFHSFSADSSALNLKTWLIMLDYRAV